MGRGGGLMHDRFWRLPPLKVFLFGTYMAQNGLPRTLVSVRLWGYGKATLCNISFGGVVKTAAKGKTKETKELKVSHKIGAHGQVLSAPFVPLLNLFG